MCECAQILLFIYIHLHIGVCYKCVILYASIAKPEKKRLTISFVKFTVCNNIHHQFCVSIGCWFFPLLFLAIVIINNIIIIITIITLASTNKKKTYKNIAKHTHTHSLTHSYKYSQIVWVRVSNSWIYYRVITHTNERIFDFRWSNRRIRRSRRRIKKRKRRRKMYVGNILDFIE